MRYLLLIVIVFSLNSCRSKTDACIERGIDQGMSRADAKEACEEGRQDSYRK